MEYGGRLIMNFIRRSSGHWVIGFIILAIGIIFLIENIMGIEVWERVWPFWPILFLLWSLAEIFQRRSIFFGIILLAIGIIFLLKNLKLYQWSESIYKFWPVIIIALGFDHLINKPEAYVVSEGQNIKRGKKVITQEDEII